VYWKCQDVDAHGQDVGAAYVSLRNNSDERLERETAVMTANDARRLARALHVSLDNDC
jgi:hypothetical protein